MDTIVLCFSAVDPAKNLSGLSELLNPQQRAKLYEAFIDDALEFSQELGVKRIVAANPTASHPYFQNLLKRHYIDLVDLPGSSEGEKIQNAFSIGFQKGAKKVVLWEGCAPTFTSKMFKEVYTRLEKDDLVVGPSMDYGAYLVGAKNKVPPIFDKVKWGTSAEFSGIIHFAEAAKLSIFSHHVWYRLLRKDDLPYFIIKLKESAKANPRLARNTQKALKEFNLM